ncbi:hypothetical protein QUE06_00760 [Lactococcus lactis]|uniref:hypothetical protein n=1 Tax=Lactococcus lactis TaxID=1358 RepID=UPI0025A1F353|nr:hypothetical protein [Lactococcus lactis]MDM7533493.1 hypothetical protein [Lactococcus lactis]
MKKKFKELQAKLDVIEEKADSIEKRLNVMEGKGIPDKPIMFPDTESHRWG